MPQNEQFQKYPLFDSLTDHDLASLVPQFHKRFFAKGVYLFYPGSSSANTYLLESGLVRLFFTNSQGKEFLLNLVRPGEIFGLPILNGDSTRLIGAAAFEDSVIYSIDSEQLKQSMPMIPQLAINLYREASISARMLLVHVNSLVTLPLIARLAFLLMRLSQVWQSGEIILLPISQSELAGWLGSSRSRLNRALSELQKRDLINLEKNGQIQILDSSGLERLIKTQT